MSKIKIQFDIINNNNHNDLGLAIWLDDRKYYDENPLCGTTPIVIEIDEDENNHSLGIILKNKQMHHTSIDQNTGDILEDSLLEISNFTVDDIEINQLFNDQSVYTHDCNGTADKQEYKFYGTMGCNGLVRFNFETPFYMWMLEHL